MATLKLVLVVIFVINSLLLIIAVLLQSGRGGGLAGALGGISSADSALGVRAASQIEKATGVMAAIFLVIALLLAFMSAKSVPLPESVPTEDRGVAGVAKKTSPPAAVQPPVTPGKKKAGAPKVVPPGTDAGKGTSSPDKPR